MKARSSPSATYARTRERLSRKVSRKKGSSNARCMVGNLTCAPAAHSMAPNPSRYMPSSSGGRMYSCAAIAPNSLRRSTRRVQDRPERPGSPDALCPNADCRRDLGGFADVKAVRRPRCSTQYGDGTMSGSEAPLPSVCAARGRCLSTPTRHATPGRTASGRSTTADDRCERRSPISGLRRCT
jgi:hypothetical protein